MPPQAEVRTRVRASEEEIRRGAKPVPRGSRRFREKPTQGPVRTEYFNRDHVSAPAPSSGKAKYFLKSMKEKMPWNKKSNASKRTVVSSPSTDEGEDMEIGGGKRVETPPGVPATEEVVAVGQRVLEYERPFSDRN